jgi:hypothetical protein|tara:strand:- start:108 stop:338 length:231 start_codon:yes stop_codon:yes gene_type:complete
VTEVFRDLLCNEDVVVKLDPNEELPIGSVCVVDNPQPLIGGHELSVVMTQVDLPVLVVPVVALDNLSDVALCFGDL